MVFVSGAFSAAAKLKEKPAEHDNPPLVPSMVNCLRNPLFRVLLLNQLIESIGAGTQYTVLPYMVDYVIEPEYNADGSKMEDAPYSSATVFIMFGGSLIVFQLVSIPLWLRLVSAVGKYKAYIIWNLTLVVTTALKIFSGFHKVELTTFLSVLWGIGNGGGSFILRAILADVYEYDQLLTGERREAEFGVYIDFFGEKLPSIPGEVVPLMLMSSLGYVANQHPQNEDVVWLLRLCFSIIPALTGLLSLPILLWWYPIAARKDKQFLDEVQAGLSLHKAGESARDPITGFEIKPAAHIQLACDPYRVAGLTAATPEASDNNDNDENDNDDNDKGDAVATEETEETEAKRRGQDAMEAFDHFSLWELKWVAASADPGVLVKITGLYSVAAAAAIVLLSRWAAQDWAANIDGAGAIDPMDAAACAPSVLVTAGDCAGAGSIDCDNCSAGLFGSACEYACPGLVAATGALASQSSDWSPLLVVLMTITVIT